MNSSLLALLSMGFFRQEYWSVLSFSPPRDLPDLGIKLVSPALQEDSLPDEPLGKSALLIDPPDSFPRILFNIMFQVIIGNKSYLWSTDRGVGFKLFSFNLFKMQYKLLD